MTSPTGDSRVPEGPESFPVAPATGVADPYFTELEPGEEPVVAGTLFLTVILLMIIAGFWVVIFTHLIGR